MSNIIEAKGKFQPVITDHGLNLDGLTEDQFFEIGHTLGNIERGMQWAIGDWYNGIPAGKGNQYFGTEGKASACQRVGINPRTAATYAYVAEIFAMSTRVDIPFSHHRVLAISDLGPTQRRSLLKRAAAEKWSSKVLADERDKVLGIWEEPVSVNSSDAIQAFVEQKLPSLPARYQKQVERAIKEASHRLADDFESEVQKAVKQRVEEQRESLKALKAKAKKEFDTAVKMKRGAAGFMTEREFKQVRGLLHPDKHPGQEAKYQKAFDIFNRMGESFSA